ncbi:transposable element Tc1 transposase [Trichonephila clavipes]|nr:transposable element Tc1 transposase [Trichonephila clavipes]
MNEMPVKVVKAELSYGEKQELATLPPNFKKSNGGGFIVWANITMDGCIHLHVFKRCTVIAVSHREVVWEYHFCFFPGVNVIDFILMETQHKTHRDHLVDEFLESENVRRIDWPVRSPDLIRTEYAWNTLGQGW